MANLANLWQQLANTLLNQELGNLPVCFFNQSVGAAGANAELPPAMVFDYEADSFIKHWMEYDVPLPGGPNQSTALNWLAANAQNIAAPNPNTTFSSLNVEDDAIRVTQQYLLNGIEHIAGLLVQHFGALHGRQLELRSEAQLDTGAGRVDLAYKVVEPGFLGKVWHILYIEFKKPKTVSIADWTPIIYREPGVLAANRFDWWRTQVKFGNAVPANVQNDPRYNVNPLQAPPLYGWAQAKARVISQQMNTYFCRNPLMNMPRVPYILASDLLGFTLFDYGRSLNNPGGGVTQTYLQAQHDALHVGFCNMREMNPVLGGVNQVNTWQPQPGAQINITFRLFLISAIWAGLNTCYESDP